MNEWHAIYKLLWTYQGHYNDVIMCAMTFQITAVSVVHLIVCSGADQRQHQSSVSLAFVRGIHQWSLDSPHKRASKTENVSIWWCHHVTILQHSFSGGGWRVVVVVVVRVGWGGVEGGGVEGGGGVLDLSADFYHREPVLRTVFPWRDVFM